MGFQDRPQQNQILFDDAGNAVAVVLDNSVYRLEARSSLVGQSLGTGAEKKVSVVDDQGDAATKRLQVEADIKPGATINVSTGAAVASGTVADLLRDTGGAGSPNMVVNGAGTPVKFEYNADPTRDIQVTSVRLVMSASFFNFNGADFGKGGGPLSNGITISIVANGGIFTGQLALLTVNEDWFRLLEFAISQAGTTDVMAASLIFGGGVFLEAGSGDEISVTINDNMTVGSRGITYLTGTVYGIEDI